MNISTIQNSLLYPPKNTQYRALHNKVICICKHSEYLRNIKYNIYVQYRFLRNVQRALCGGNSQENIIYSFEFPVPMKTDIEYILCYCENWKLNNDAQSKIQFMYFISVAIFCYLHSIVFQYLSSFHRVRVIQSCQC